MPAAGVDLCTKADGKDRSDHSAPDRFRSTRVHRPLTRRIRDVALAVEVLGTKNSRGTRCSDDPTHERHQHQSRQARTHSYKVSIPRQNVKIVCAAVGPPCFRNLLPDRPRTQRRLSELGPLSSRAVSGCARGGIGRLRGCPGLSGSATGWSVT